MRAFTQGSRSLEARHQAHERGHARTVPGLLLDQEGAMSLPTPYYQDDAVTIYHLPNMGDMVNCHYDECRTNSKIPGKIEGQKHSKTSPRTTGWIQAVRRSYRKAKAIRRGSLALEGRKSHSRNWKASSRKGVSKNRTLLYLWKSQVGTSSPGWKHSE